MIETLLSLGLVIIAAKLAEAALARVRVNSTIAHTATGILLGPWRWACPQGCLLPGATPQSGSGGV